MVNNKLTLEDSLVGMRADHMSRSKKLGGLGFRDLDCLTSGVG